MRPKRLTSEPYRGDERFVIDTVARTIWHRVFHRVLYADTDRSGVVYHANFLRYFEVGRAALMRDMGYPYASVEEQGYLYPVVELGLTFAAPLRYDEGVRIHTRPAALERVRVSFDYLLTSAADGRTVCLGFTRHCALNRTWQPTAVDPLTLQMWEAFPR